VLGQEVLAKEKMKNKLPRIVKNFPVIFLIYKFFERDQDITYYEEFHYIFITLRELVEVIKTRNK